MILRCEACKGTEFEVEAFELVKRTFDAADIGDEWKQSEPLEESYIVSARCEDCGKEYLPKLFGSDYRRLQSRLRGLGKGGARYSGKKSLERV